MTKKKRKDVQQYTKHHTQKNRKTEQHPKLEVINKRSIMNN